MVGDKIRANANACACRWFETKAPICGRYVGREWYWSVDSSSFVEGAGREGSARRAERRMMSSTNSAGNDFDCMCSVEVDLDFGSRFEVEFEDRGDRSTVLSAVRRRCALAALIHAVLYFYGKNNC